MRCPRQRRRIGTRRQNGELAIELHRVGIDDDGTRLLGNLERELGLAARRRPGEEEDGHGAACATAVLCPSWPGLTRPSTSNRSPVADARLTTETRRAR